MLPALHPTSKKVERPFYAVMGLSRGDRQDLLFILAVYVRLEIRICRIVLIQKAYDYLMIFNLKIAVI